MSSRNHNKNKDVIKELEKTISPILIVNNSSLKPYVELFEYAPENVYQQPLGMLVGFFEIKEYSEDSAYIVNFLTSVLKKEYYINPKRSVSESLDSALHKVNMALSELAKHDNIGWLGKLNAAICVFEKNSAHFSVVGTAKVFLYRSTGLSDVSEGLASDSPQPHPLKTFVNVSSGRLEKDDRMLITSEDIFHILSLAQLRKNFERLEGKKFVQFLKTALSNQLEMIASLSIEIKEKEVMEVKIPESKKEAMKTENFFSGKTYEKAAPATAAISDTKKDEPEEPIQETEYTDKKTGHIYVQGEANEIPNSGKAYIFWNITKEKFAQGWCGSKIYLGGRFSLLKRSISKKVELAKIERGKRKQEAAEEKKKEQELRALAEEEKRQLKQQEKERQQLLDQQEKQEKEQARILREQEEQARLETEKKTRLLEKQKEKELLEEKNKKDVLAKQQSQERIQDIQPTEANETPKLSFREKLNQAILERQKNLANQEENADAQIEDLEKETAIIDTIGDHAGTSNIKEEQPSEENEEKFFSRYREKQTILLQEIKQGDKKGAESMPEMFKRESRQIFKEQIEEEDEKNESITEIKTTIKPDFSKIKNIFNSLSYRQKISAFLVIATIIIVPFFIVSWSNKQPAKTQAVEDIPASVPVSGESLLASEKNMDLRPDERTLLSRNGIVSILAAGENNVIITKENVIVINGQEQKEYPLPEETKTPVRATYMKDLALIFILTDKNTVFSFSPVSSRFAANTVSIDQEASSMLIGTYMTYLYALDPIKSQIYRYPRATGGFGEKTNWLKDEIVLSSIKDMIIDENIYCAMGDKVLKLFKGSPEDFPLEQSDTLIEFDKIYTSLDSQFFYVLDLENSRLVKYDKASGSIAKQYFSEKIKNATALSVNDQNTTAYIATPDSVVSIGL